MTALAHHRYTITVPDNMAKLVEKVCAQEGRNRSELFREAFRVYMSAGHRSTGTSIQANDPLYLFWPEQSPQTASAIDREVLEREKDRLLEQWAQMVENSPELEDVRAVSADVNAIAGEPIA